MDLELRNLFVGYFRGVRFVKGNTKICMLSQPENIDTKPELLLLNWLKTDEVIRIEIDMSYVGGFAVSPAENAVAVYGSGGIDLIDLTTQKVMVSFREKEVECAVFRDEKTLLVVQSGENVVTLDIDSGATYEVLGRQEGVVAISQHPSSSNILLSETSQEGAALIFLDLPKYQSLASEVGGINFSAEGIIGLFSPNGDYVAVVNWAVRLCNFPEMEVLAAFDLNGQQFDIASYDEIDDYYPPYPTRPLGWSNPVFSPDSSSLICQSPDSRIFEWDLENLQLKNEWQGYTDGRHYLDVSSDGKWLAATGNSGNVKVLDISRE